MEVSSPYGAQVMARAAKEANKVRATEPTSVTPAKRTKLSETPDDGSSSDSVRLKKKQEISKRPPVDVFDSGTDVELDKDDERRAARRAGFDPYEMMDVEKQYFPEYIPYSADYVSTRNFILMKWKERPNTFLPWETVSRGLAVRF